MLESAYIGCSCYEFKLQAVNSWLTLSDTTCETTLIAAFFCYHTQIATLNGCKALSSKFLTTLVDHCRHMQLLEICGAAADDGAKSRQQFPGGTQNFPILQRPFFCQSVHALPLSLVTTCADLCGMSAC